MPVEDTTKNLPAPKKYDTLLSAITHSIARLAKGDKEFNPRLVTFDIQDVGERDQCFNVNFRYQGGFYGSVVILAGNKFVVEADMLVDRHGDEF